MKMRNPTPDEIREARAVAKHSQAQAAELIHSTGRRWRDWESGVHEMSPAAFELYVLKTQGILFNRPAVLDTLSISD